MSNVTTTVRPSFASASAARIYNLSMPTAGAEYSQLVNNATKRLIIRTRLPSELRMAYVSGETSTNYITVLPNCCRLIESVDLDSFTIYFRSSVSNQILEIEEWT